LSKRAKNKNAAPICCPTAPNAPFNAPPEKTGLTPEEEAYVPRREAHPLPRGVFILLLCALLAAFAGGGIFYYHSALRPEQLYQNATHLFNEGDFEGALALYRKVLRARPERRDTLFRIGCCYEMLGKDDEAAASYTRHLENQPRDLAALLRLGNVRLRRGEFENALAPFEDAVKLSANNAEAHHSLGKVYERLGSPERAALNYERAIKSDKKDPELLLSASKSLMTLGRHESALEGYEKAQALLPDGDNRGTHGSAAARAMLGWPTNPSVILIPGKSLGKLALGISRTEAVQLLGEPGERETKETGETDSAAHENWIYDEGRLILYFANGRVRQIQTNSQTYRTGTGLGIANFLHPKYADRFDRWTDNDTDNAGFRYIIKGGGLAFYASGENRAAIIYRGEYPPTDPDQEFWTKLKPED